MRTLPVTVVVAGLAFGVGAAAASGTTTLHPVLSATLSGRVGPPIG